jgi:hypothetical protein
VAISLSGKPIQANGDTDPWPSMRDDMRRRWIVFREQVGVSASEDCAVRIESGRAGILAALRYQSGFWIVPSSQCEMQIDGVGVRESVPLSAGTTLSLAGASLKVRQSEPLLYAAGNAAAEARRAAE